MPKGTRVIDTSTQVRLCLVIGMTKFIPVFTGQVTASIELEIRSAIGFALGCHYY